MLLERMARVRAQRVLGIVARLLGTLLRRSALLVDVVACLAALRFVLALGLGGLTTGVWGGHGCVELCCGASKVLERRDGGRV
jgi:hypothetical protein